MKIIDTYSHRGAGYDPYLITPGWQVAQLNYAESEAANHVARLDVHHLTDEAFYLMKGTVLLIGAEITDDEICYDMQVMEPGIVYNVRKNAWHTIAMQPGAEVLIIENKNTHLDDCAFHYFNEKQKQEFMDEVNRTISSHTE